MLGRSPLYGQPPTLRCLSHCSTKRSYWSSRGDLQQEWNIDTALTLDRMLKGHIRMPKQDAKGSHQMAPNVRQDAKGSHQDAKGSHQMAPNVGHQSRRITPHAFVMIPLPIPVNRSICRIERPISLRRRSALSRSFFGNPTM